MLRRSFGPKKEEEETACREFHNKGFRKLYWSTNVSIRITAKLNLSGHVARIRNIKMEAF